MADTDDWTKRVARPGAALESEVGVAENEGRECRKCGYRRGADDDAPAYECPRCGAVYAKVDAALAREADGEPGPKRRAQKPRRAPSGKVSECRACDGPVSRRAKRCPHCGEDRPARGWDAKQKTMVALIAGFVVLYLVGDPGGGDAPDTPDADVATAAAPSADQVAETPAMREAAQAADEQARLATRMAAKREADRRRAEREAERERCRNDVQCWGEKHHVDATAACERRITAYAKYDFEWTNGWLDYKLTRWNWRDQAAGTLIYRGDALKFQNGFGAWQRMRYSCAYNPAAQRVLRVSVTAR